jgi:hypothetical protein
LERCGEAGALGGIVIAEHVVVARQINRAGASMTTNGTWQFHVGMDVVCIDASQPGYTSAPSDLKAGATYRLRWVGVVNRYPDGEFLGVKLEGLDRGECQAFGDNDPPFRATRFRPLVTDRLGSLKALLAGNGPAPSIDEPRRERVIEEEKV